ncbi:MAG: MATE family efflux transporter [Eubacteriales bacterium]|nr:MATE family efflux transporter [Eubacteriales bacterium]
MSLVVTLIYNLADTFFVAQTGDTNIIAGVSLGAPVFTLLMSFGNIFAQGGSSLLSILMGKKKEDEVRRVSSFCFFALLMTGVVIGFLMILLRTPAVLLLGADADTFAPTGDYYTWLALGAPFIMVSFVHSNLLRAEGRSTASMTGTIAGALVNIILDPIFISVLGMGAKGAAIATVIGYIVTDLYFMWFVRFRSRILSLNPSEMFIPASFIRSILTVGTPAAIVNIMQSVCIVLTNQFLLPYGNEKIAAMGIALKVNMIALLLLTGFAFGGAPLFGYFYGAGDRKKLSELFRFCRRFIFCTALVLAAALFAAAPAMMGAFTGNRAIAEAGALMLRLQVITAPCVSIVLLLTIIFQSFGKSAGSFVLSISRQGVVFMIVLALASHFVGYMGILCAQAVSDLLAAVIAVALFRVMLRGQFSVQ